MIATLTTLDLGSITLIALLLLAILSLALLTLVGDVARPQRPRRHRRRGWTGGLRTRAQGWLIRHGGRSHVPDDTGAGILHPEHVAVIDEPESPLPDAGEDQDDTGADPQEPFDPLTSPIPGMRRGAAYDHSWQILNQCRPDWDGPSGEWQRYQTSDERAELADARGGTT